MLRFEDISAWISVDGIARKSYAIERPASNSLTCWVASESGKSFSVNWSNDTRDFPLQGVVSIDGAICDNHIMLDAHSYPDRPNAVGVSYARTSDYTRRDFMFSVIGVTDDDAYLHTLGNAYQFGTITLELWRLDVVDVVTKSLEHQYGGPVLEAQVIHEQAKKAGTHHVKYGMEYASPAPVIDMVTAHKLDQGPYVSFTFKYRPFAILMADHIVPRSTGLYNSIEHTGTNDHSTMITKIQTLEYEVPRREAPQPQTGQPAPEGTPPRKGMKTKAVPTAGNLKTPEIIDLT